jgi:hypothetical protein
MQSPSLAQEVGHAPFVPEQTYAPQLAALPAEPAGDGAHVPPPASPLPAHVSHAPVQGPSQQKPSTQLPCAHSRQSPCVQSAPAVLLHVAPTLFCAWHTPFPSQ